MPKVDRQILKNKDNIVNDIDIECELQGWIDDMNQEVIQQKVSRPARATYYQSKLFKLVPIERQRR